MLQKLLAQTDNACTYIYNINMYVQLNRYKNNKESTTFSLKYVDQHIYPNIWNIFIKNGTHKNFIENL